MPKTYTTILGDQWDMIAVRQWGSEGYTSQLMDANQDYLDYTIFPAGIVLTIPDTVNKTNVNVAPWRR